jgi:serpin B
MDLLGKYYDAEIFGGDLSAINMWVKKKTEGKIDSILEKPSSKSAGVILNALYFKGIWDREFEKKNTRDETFHRSASSNEIKVPIMHRRDMYKIVDSDTMQVISLPYKGKALSMVIILPKVMDGLPSIEKDLNAQAIRELFVKLDKQPERKVSLYLPKFRMDSQYDLSGTFQALGMKDAFSPTADFGGMGWSKGNLWIGQIRHRAIVEVDEEGTQAEAAAPVDATGRSEAVKELQFRADHPFLFVIRDNETGTILLIGKIVNPA